MTTTALIFCAGAAQRWGGPNLKQLAAVEGEPVLHRTVQQCLAHGIKPVIVGTDLRLRHPDAEWFEPDADQFMADTVLSTRKLWKGRMLALLGDVFFSDRCFRTMAASKGLKFFGRAGRSKITGSPCGEVFAWAWDWKPKPLVKAWAAGLEHARKLGAPRDSIGTPVGTPWQPYRHLIGCPVDAVNFDREIWEEVNDWTDDFDTFDRYLEFCTRYQQRTIIQGPTMRAKGEHRLRFVATGTGHCGTGYVAMMLRSAGVYCGHEGVFNYGIQREGLKHFWADSSWAAAPFLADPICKDACIIHITRDPLAVLRSWWHGGINPETNPWVEQFINLPPRRPKDWGINDALTYNAAWYVGWNRLIEVGAPEAIHFKVEDRTKLFELIDLPPQYSWDNPKYNRKFNHRIAEPLTWNDIPNSCHKEELQRMAEQYGYPVA